MGAAQMIGADQEVIHQSGASRLGNAFCLVLASPFVLFAAALLVGWNEKEAVCSVEAITQARLNFHEVGCTASDATMEGLVFFSCDLQPTGLGDIALGGGAFTFSSLAGLATRSEMYQCIEKKQSRTEKDTAGGGTSTVVTYSYEKGWAESSIRSQSFHNQPGQPIPGKGPHPCQFHNPAWPTQVPTSGRTYAPSANVGPFSIGPDLVQRIPLTAPASPTSPPAGFTAAGTAGNYEYGAVANADGTGRVRLQFLGNDWGHPTMSVMGSNLGGHLGPWKAKGTWGCKGNALQDLKPGVKDAEEFLDELEAEAGLTKWILRALGFIVLWLGFTMCFAPLEVFADCIPCVGPCLGDSIAAVTGCLSCIPACACFTLVAGIVWLFMRPLLGGALLLCFAGMVALLLGLRLAYGKSRRPKPWTQAQAAEAVDEAVELRLAHGSV